LASSLFDVNPELAVSHHYRKCDFSETTCAGLFRQQTRDDIALRFRDKLQRLIELSLSNIKHDLSRSLWTVGRHIDCDSCVYYSQRFHGDSAHLKRVSHFLSSEFLWVSQRMRRLALEKSRDKNFLSCECWLHPLVYNYIFNGCGNIVWLIFICTLLRVIFVMDSLDYRWTNRLNWYCQIYYENCTLNTILINIANNSIYQRSRSYMTTVMWTLIIESVVWLVPHRECQQSRDWDVKIC